MTLVHASTAPQDHAEPTPEDYAVAAAAGDPEAMSYLYERYSDPLFRWIFVRVGNHTESEDVAADTWLKAVRSIHTYKSIGSGFPAWLFKIAANTINSRYRSASRLRETPTENMLDRDQTSDGITPEEAALRASSRAEIVAALRRLSKKQAECVTLRFFDGLTLAETASVMGTTINNVKLMQHRAVKRLAKMLPARGATAPEPVRVHGKVTNRATTTHTTLDR